MDNAIDVLGYMEDGLKRQGGRIMESEVRGRDHARAYVYAKDQFAVVTVTMMEVGYLDELPWMTTRESE